MGRKKWMWCLSLLPVVAQAGLLAFAVSQRNWMFVAMLAPGVLMSLGYSFTSALHNRDEARRLHEAPTGLRQLTEGTEISSSHFIFPRLPSVSLETLLSKADHYEALWMRVVRNWQQSTGELPVAVGITQKLSALQHTDTATEKKQSFYLDIFQQGPHVLVAGTTGSGKSLFLQSWCTSLALAYSPAVLNFIFLDFKGGATFRVLHKLPHVVGFVSDLNLSMASRALRAIEVELKHREELVANAGVGTLYELANPPARLLVVVDEFQALRFALPDYSDHLVRIASQGRSLGMHLILATQNPLGQVSTDMKANIASNICLRVRDKMQSSELLGNTLGSEIPLSLPGAGFLSDGESVIAFRSAHVEHLGGAVQACCAAVRFCAEPLPNLLFSENLPRKLSLANLPTQSTAPAVHLGLRDTGVVTQPCQLDVSRGNTAIIGAMGRGKTTLIHALSSQLRSIYGPQAVRWSAGTTQGYLDENPSASPRFWLIDNADILLDPLSNTALHREFMEALRTHTCQLIFTASSTKNVRYPDYCSTRIVFPSGDKTTDLMSGIPSPALKDWEAREFEIPGRAALLEPGGTWKIQCLN